jgi:hypothetical protein
MSAIRFRVTTGVTTEGLAPGLGRPWVRYLGCVAWQLPPPTFRDRGSSQRLSTPSTQWRGRAIAIRECAGSAELSFCAWAGAVSNGGPSLLPVVRDWLRDDGGARNGNLSRWSRGPSAPSPNA